MTHLTPYTSSAEGYYPSLDLMIQSICVFLLANQLFNKTSKIIDFISKRTLPIYLMTYFIDQVVYPFYINHVERIQNLFPFIIPIIVLNFIISILLTLIVERITYFIWPFIQKWLMWPYEFISGINLTKQKNVSQ